MVFLKGHKENLRKTIISLLTCPCGTGQISWFDPLDPTIIVVVLRSKTKEAQSWFDPLDPTIIVVVLRSKTKEAQSWFDPLDPTIVFLRKTIISLWEIMVRQSIIAILSIFLL